MHTSIYTVLLFVCVFNIASGNSAAETLNKLSEDYVTWKYQAFPESATLLDNHDNDDKLNQYSLQQYRLNKEKCDEFLTELGKIKTEDLSDEDTTTYDILKAELEQYIDGYKWREYGALNLVNYMGGVHRSPGWIRAMNFDNEADFVKYNNRMKLYPNQLDQAIELMKLAIDKRRTNDRESMSRVPEQIGQGMKPGTENPFYWPYLNKNSTLTPQQLSTLSSEALDIINNQINPALAKLKTFLSNEYGNNLRAGYGVGSWDNGKEYYKACLKYHLSIDATPEQINKTGWQEFHRIKASMEKIMRDNGFSGSIAEYFKYQREDPEQRKKYYEKTPEWILNQYKRIVYQVIDPKMLDIFHKMAPFNVTVEEQPYDGAPASYNLARRVFYANTRDAANQSSIAMVAIAAHEASPGHHYQLTIASQLDLPKFRRNAFGAPYYAIVPLAFPSYTAYVEGWGLYSEFLGEEMNIYDKSHLQLFGRYSTEIFRAIRLIVDAGIHAFGMERQYAIDMMVNYTAFSVAQIEAEVDRYISIPGQACAYKMGELKLRELRDKATQKLGSDFDVRDFHTAVLSTSSAPLHVVEKAVNDYITDHVTGDATRFTATPVLFLITIITYFI